MKKQILENLPFYGNISTEIGIMGYTRMALCLEVGGGR
jgi:hypothetical protein